MSASPLVASRGLNATFLASIYLTLVAASACLMAAEDKFLPGIFPLLILVAALLAIAYVVEGRWVLSRRTENLLAICIAVGALVWVAWPLLEPPASPLEDSAPPASVLMLYSGPLLLLVMLAKLFRPKQTIDFWVLHTVGMLEVTLACVMATEALFGFLLFVYLTCLLWSLALFYLHREYELAEGRERVRAARGERSTARLSSLRTRVLAPGQACCWAGCVAVVAFAMFLVLPRVGEGNWDPFTLSRGEGSLATGYSHGIDLHRTGRVQVSDEIAFEVYAQDSQGRPKTDLPAEQRWRGAVMDQYDAGRWLSRSYLVPERARRVRQRSLPDFGPTQSFLTFHVNHNALCLFLADPVALPWGPQKLLPAIDDNDVGVPAAAFYADADGTLLPVPELEPGHYRYRQVFMNEAEEDASPPLASGILRDKDYYLQPIPGIREWTSGLLQRLIDAGRISSKDVALLSSGPWVPADRREAIARGLCDYLATSGEFGYSLDLHRQYANMDPTEDFLRYIRQGHCERFASALALMLRSCQIPSRIVVGFRGAEAHKVPAGQGWYIVRQSHAHSWVEAMILREKPGEPRTRHWLTLDPTPSEELPGADGSVVPSGWKELLLSGQGVWRSFVLDYNMDRRRAAATVLTNGVAEIAPVPSLFLWIEEGPGTERFWKEVLPWLIGIACVVVCGYLFCRFWSARVSEPRVAAALAAYARLRSILKRHLRIVPRRTQTPLEFAQAAKQVLRYRLPATDLIDVPEQVVALLYRAKYGDQELDEAQRQDLELRVNELANALNPPNQ